MHRERMMRRPGSPFHNENSRRIFSAFCASRRRGASAFPIRQLMRCPGPDSQLTAKPVQAGLGAATPDCPPHTWPDRSNQASHSATAEPAFPEPPTGDQEELPPPPPRTVPLDNETLLGERGDAHGSPDIPPYPPPSRPCQQGKGLVLAEPLCPRRYRGEQRAVTIDAAGRARSVCSLNFSVLLPPHSAEFRPTNWGTWAVPLGTLSIPELSLLVS